MPLKLTVSLQKDTVEIGGPITVYYGSTSANIGDVDGNMSVKVSYDFTTLTTETSDNFTITAESSTAATTSNGEVTNPADTKAGIAVNTQASANDAIEIINNAITKVSEERSKLGAYQNRLEHTLANLGTSSENLTSAESRIRDVNMAKEMSIFSKNNILGQAAQAMLAQANQQPQQVLQLLR
jgi:flagellin